MKKKSLFLLAGFVLLSSVTLFAWGGKTHKKMTSDAYFIMPKAFRTYLGEVPGAKPKAPYLKELIEASIEPDSVLKDFRNHVFHIHGYNMGNGPFHVEDLAKEIAQDIKNKASKKKVVQKLGWLAHYIADLAQPLHTGVATWEGIEEKSYHSSYEKAIDTRIYTFGVRFDGCTVTSRISARMVYEALWANQYYAAIEQAYTNGERYDDVKGFTAQCYSRGVNNIVDVWYSVWSMSGGKLNPAVDGKPRNYPPFGKQSLRSSYQAEHEVQASDATKEVE